LFADWLFFADAFGKPMHVNDWLDANNQPSTVVSQLPATSSQQPVTRNAQRVTRNAQPDTSICAKKSSASFAFF
jgi:hypothetical protein